MSQNGVHCSKVHTSLWLGENVLLEASSYINSRT